jgi:hypothetical protein
MKEYRVGLDILTRLAMTDTEVADFLGLPRSALTKEQFSRGIRWRYRPCTGHAQSLRDAIGRIASKVRPERVLPSGSGIKGAALAIEVLHEMVTCSVMLPLDWLALLAMRIPKLNSIEMTCRLRGARIARSDHAHTPVRGSDLTEKEALDLYEQWRAAGRPSGPVARSPLVIGHSDVCRGRKAGTQSGRTDVNEYIVSLNAIAKASATGTDVASLLGLPLAAFTRRPTETGVLWRCEPDAAEPVGIADRIEYLASRIETRRSRPSGKITDVYLDIGVLHDEAKACSVSIPLAGLRSLAWKLPELSSVQVSCYPCERKVCVVSESGTEAKLRFGN